MSAAVTAQMTLVLKNHAGCVLDRVPFTADPDDCTATVATLVSRWVLTEGDTLEIALASECGADNQEGK